MERPTVSQFPRPDAIFIGLVAHRDSISAGILKPGRDDVVVNRIL
jgi:hypothetical protein